MVLGGCREVTIRKWLTLPSCGRADGLERLAETLPEGRAIELLCIAMSDSSWYVRCRAAEVAASFPVPCLIYRLGHSASHDVSWPVRASAVESLSFGPPQRVWRTIAKVLRTDCNAHVRAYAAISLALTGVQCAKQILQDRVRAETSWPAPFREDRLRRDLLSECG